MLKKKLFHSVSYLSGYRETWKPQKRVAFRFLGTGYEDVTGKGEGGREFWDACDLPPPPHPRF